MLSETYMLENDSCKKSLFEIHQRFYRSHATQGGDLQPLAYMAALSQNVCHS